MRKETIFFKFLLGILITGSVFSMTFAQTNAATITSTPTNQHQQRTQERRDNIGQYYANRLTNHFDFYYQRFTNLIDKLEISLNNSLSNLMFNGKDAKYVIDAQAKLAEAKMALGHAQLVGYEAIMIFEAIEPTQYEAQRDQALQARDAAQQARIEYLETLSLLKQAVRLAKIAH